MDPKLIYLARRNPALTAAQFPQAWQEHVAYAQSFGTPFLQHFKGAAQLLKVADPALPPSFTNDFDGANLMTMSSPEGLRAVRQDTSSQELLLADEERVFAGPVGPWTMAGDEHLIAGHRRGGAALLAFLYPQNALAPAAFASGSRRAAEEMSSLPALAAASRIAWTDIDEPAPAYGFRALVEVWFSDLAAAIAAAAAPGVAATLEQTGIADPLRSACLVTRRAFPAAS